MAAPEKKSVKAEDLVAEAARRALDDAEGDVKAATAMLELAVAEPGPLRDALLEPLIAQACSAAIGREIAWRRRGIWTGQKSRHAGKSTPQEIQRQTSRVVSLAAGTLLMFPLPGGKALGQATRTEIAAAAEFYGRQAADMGSKSRWLQLIAQSVPDGKTVSDVLSDKRLRELQREAQNESL